MNRIFKLGMAVAGTGVILAGTVFLSGNQFVSEYSYLKQQEAAARETLDGLQVEKELLEFAHRSGLETSRDADESEYKEKLKKIDGEIQATRDDLGQKSTRVKKFGGGVKKAVVKIFDRLANLIFS